MAAKLQCEICGGKLIGKPGGIFECENCGTEYSTEWARAKIQEITGTVKVEGTVEVTGKVQIDGGTVQVDSSANKEALLRRGGLALEDGQWDKAKEYFDQVLNLDAACAEAYLGLAMADAETKDREIYAAAYAAAGSQIRGSRHAARARQFDPALETWLAGLDEKGRQADEAAKDAETRRREKLVAFRKRCAVPGRMIAAGSGYTVGVRADGTVVAVGSNSFGQCEVSGWTDIVAIASGGLHTVGLKADGTVVAVGSDPGGKCNFSGWTGIAAISVGNYHTVGVRADGTVVATGETSHRRCEVSGWRNIVAVAAGGLHTVGLRADGTVTAVGNNELGQCDVFGWTDIVAIAAGSAYTVGLKADGTVVGTGTYGYMVSGWTDIAAISEGGGEVVGLTADGTVIATDSKRHTWFGDDSQCKVAFDWTDIVAIAAGNGHTVGLKADGTFVAAGNNNDGQCEVSGWKLFKNVDTIVAERKAAAEKAEAERTEKIAALKRDKDKLIVELAGLKGMFTGKRRKEIEAQLDRLDAELKRLE